MTDLNKSAEPVAWFIADDNGEVYRATGYEHERDQWRAVGHEVYPLYAAPQPAQTAVVMDDERAALADAIEEMEIPDTRHCSNPELFEQGFEVARSTAASLARAAFPQPVAQPVLAAQLDDARRYQLCRESAIERGLFQTGGEYDAMVDSSLLKNGKEPLTGRGHNYGKKVAKDGSLYRTQLMEQAPAVTLLGDGATTLWRVANAPQAGRGLAFHRPFVLQRQEIGVTVCYCPDGRLKRWKSETEAQRVCNRLNTAIATFPQPVAQPVAQREDVLKQAAALCDQLAEEFPDGAARLCAKTLRRFNEQLDKKETRQ